MGTIKCISYSREENIFNYEQWGESKKKPGFEQIDYIIYQNEKKKAWEHFVFKILLLEDDRIMLYWVDNGGYLSVSNKGIIKPMLYEILKLYNKDIVSSTNTGAKVLTNEGRIQDMTDFWERFKNKDSMVAYLTIEDRYVLKK